MGLEKLYEVKTAFPTQRYHFIGRDSDVQSC